MFKVIGSDNLVYGNNLTRDEAVRVIEMKKKQGRNGNLAPVGGNATKASTLDYRIEEM